jgi:hypothetical protein
MSTPEDITRCVCGFQDFQGPITDHPTIAVRKFTGSDYVLFSVTSVKCGSIATVWVSQALQEWINTSAITASPTFISYLIVSQGVTLTDVAYKLH